MITCQNYCVADPDALETPAMLLFQDLMDYNIQSVCELVGGGENLIAHVKTHKSEAVALKQVEQGGGQPIGDIQKESYGDFGWFIDPAGFKVELWRPKSFD